MERCELTKLIDWFEVCLKVQEQPKQEGTILGFLYYAVACSNYTEGFSYDWVTGNGKCHGDWRPMMWRR